MNEDQLRSKLCCIARHTKTEGLETAAFISLTILQVCNSAWAQLGSCLVLARFPCVSVVSYELALQIFTEHSHVSEDSVETTGLMTLVQVGSRPLAGWPGFSSWWRQGYSESQTH